MSDPVGYPSSWEDGQQGFPSTSQYPQVGAMMAHVPQVGYGPLAEAPWAAAQQYGAQQYGAPWAGAPWAAAQQYAAPGASSGAGLDYVAYGGSIARSVESDVALHWTATEVLKRDIQLALDRLRMVETQSVDGRVDRSAGKDLQSAYRDIRGIRDRMQEKYDLEKLGKGRSANRIRRLPGIRHARLLALRLLEASDWGRDRKLEDARLIFANSGINGQQVVREHIASFLRENQGARRQWERGAFLNVSKYLPPPVRQSDPTPLAVPTPSGGRQPGGSPARSSTDRILPVPPPPPGWASRRHDPALRQAGDGYASPAQRTSAEYPPAPPRATRLVAGNPPLLPDVTRQTMPIAQPSYAVEGNASPRDPGQSGPVYPDAWHRPFERTSQTSVSEGDRRSVSAVSPVSPIDPDQAADLALRQSSHHWGDNSFSAAARGFQPAPAPGRPSQFDRMDYPPVTTSASLISPFDQPVPVPPSAQANPADRPQSVGPNSVSDSASMTSVVRLVPRMPTGGHSSDRRRAAEYGHDHLIPRKPVPGRAPQQQAR